MVVLLTVTRNRERLVDQGACRHAVRATIAKRTAGRYHVVQFDTAVPQRYARQRTGTTRKQVMRRESGYADACCVSKKWGRGTAIELLQTQQR